MVLQTDKNYGYCWDRKCHPQANCKTCRGRKFLDCTSCPDGLFLGAMRFTETASGKKPFGLCRAPPTLKDFPLSYKLPGVQCSFSICRNAATGLALGFKKPYAETERTICTRICLLGGQLTMIKNLQRYDKPESREGKRNVDAKFRSGGMSSPVCAYNKIAMCSKNPHFNTANCERQRAQNPQKTHSCWEQERCNVQKKLECVAILPSSVGKHHQPDITKTVSKVLGTDLTAYKNECKHAINPCDPVALYM